MSKTLICSVFMREVGAAFTKAADALQSEDAPPIISGTLIPLYSRPLSGTAVSPTWNAVIAAKTLHPTVPVVAIVNPNSGPGAVVDTAYVTGVAAMKKSGVVIAGYVSTKYGARSESDVRSDIDKWKLWYPDVTGIFLDEMNNKVGGEDYYRKLTVYAKAHGFTLVVGNPGADTIPSYVGSVDTIVIYEKAGLPPASVYSGWHAKHPRTGFGVLSYGVGNVDAFFIAAIKPTIGWILLTDDTLVPNPWDNVPTYLNELLAQLV